jgi:hypothetical protein
VKIPHFTKTHLLTMAVFFAVLLVQTRLMAVGINLSDEGLVVEGARQYAAGTYEPDVFAHYSSRYMIESIVLRTADNLLALRFLWAVLRAASAALLFWIVASLAGAGAAFPAVLLFLIAPGPWHKAWVPLVTLVTAATFLGFRRKPRQSTALLVGVSAGFAFAIHPYTGALLLPALLVAVWQAVEPGGRRWQAPALTMAGFTLSTLALGGWVRQVDWAGFVTRHWAIVKSDWLGLHEFFISLVTGAPRGLFFAGVLDVLLVVLIGAFVVAVRRPAWLTPGGGADLFGLALLAAAGLPKIVARFDESHVLQNMPLFLVLAATLAAWGLQQAKTRWAKVGGAALAVWLVAFGVWALAHDAYYFGGPGMARGREAKLDNAFAPMMVTAEEKETIETIVASVRTLCPRDRDAIFVTPFAPMFYALAERPNVVPLALFDRPENLIGIKDRQVMKLLAKRKPHAWIMERVRTDGRLKNEFARVAPTTYRWLQANYEIDSKAGSFLVMRLKNLRQ